MSKDPDKGKDQVAPPLPPELLPVEAVVEPAPPKQRIENLDADMAIAFVNIGAPLQHGTPKDPEKLLEKTRKEKKQQGRIK